MIRLSPNPSLETVAELTQAKGLDVLAGEFETLRPLCTLAEAGARDRLIVAAFPGQSALGFLARALEEGASPTLLSESLLAVVALRVLPRMDEGGLPLLLTETLHVDPPLRRALQNGGKIDELRHAARQQGFEEMVDRARAMKSLPAEMLEDLKRHRYLERAA
jgi:hypothetical protein